MEQPANIADANVTELGYARFGVKSLDEWRRFTADILGAEMVDDESGALHLRTDAWHHRLTFIEDGSDDLLCAGFRVAGAEEFDAMKARLTTAQIPFREGTREEADARFVLDLLMLDDPAGNPLEIFHGPRVDAHKPFHPSRPMFGRFVTADGGVGHMILKHDGLDRMYAFYRLLGLRGGIEYRFPGPGDATVDILFMHCNSRDHSVAFGPPSSKRINHLMLEVDNIDDVLLTQEKVKASDYPIAIDLGKHANDHMISFYFATPSGWLIEVGTAGRPATHQSEYYVQDTYGHTFIGGH